MTKELEALETLKDMLIGNGCNNSINDYVDNLILPIKQTLINKSKKEQGYDILLSILIDNWDFEEEKEMMIYTTAKACEETFGKDSKELVVIKELLKIDENKYIDFCKEHSKDE